MVHNVSQCQNTLVYGRANTFLLSVNDPILQVALRVTEDDGPGQGDMSLLRTLVVNQTVLKRETITSGDKNKNEREKKDPIININDKKEASVKSG